MFKKYYSKEEVEARPYITGEDLDGVLVSFYNHPKEGDMIVRDSSDSRYPLRLVEESEFKKKYALEEDARDLTINLLSSLRAAIAIIEREVPRDKRNELLLSDFQSAADKFSDFIMDD